MLPKCSLSKNKLWFMAHLERKQLNKLCNNDAVRIDFGVHSRICYALDCDISDILIYKKPEKI
ncbi:helix-turn-helix transcriptional regulator [Blautia coccoides]|uniref:XRE family transcriptional regulator n=2 Tax=Blautia producta TaxID=33035 RepID=A0A7G5N3C4_9FIRM|nr:MULTISPECIES: helix-turn-helix transcriptional regulator [Blautia]MCQ4741924.1 helix-turn-helix transcriptional regulator [Blautia producta]MCR1986889.1 helix-turn-helix transcriptional regulator [Blautia coccoides]MDU5218744.1 helix-turn-helix transcriptional regulator [Blautia producta]MDU5383260.1 helix-turn-helix transcriptional regulator [Blautia producta]MDU6881829.1 helix-turn-helix transcriptional regulator [Blautia producta]